MENKKDKPEQDKSNSKKIILLSTLTIVLIGAVVLFLVFILKPKLNSSKYDVTLVDTTKGILTLQVVTGDTTGTELISINDELLKKYAGTFPTVYIFYFDDKTYTTDFFSLFVKNNLTPDEQQEISHNVAMYYYDKSANNNCLNKRLKVGWSILKCY